jgi:hypothetical protein
MHNSQITFLVSVNSEAERQLMAVMHAFKKAVFRELDTGDTKPVWRPEYHRDGCRAAHVDQQVSELLMNGESSIVIL